MPTNVPLPGYLATRLGLDRTSLAGVENPPGQNNPARLDPEQFFTLPAVRHLAGSHPGLLLDHFVPFDRHQNAWSFDSKIKGPWLRAFAHAASASYCDPQAAWRGWAKRHRALYPDGGSVRRKTVRPGWRWVIGLGNQTILETGLTLHHTYAIPYMPGSAIKGLTQALVVLNLEPVRLTPILGAPDTLQREQTYLRLFGTQEAAGEVVFVGGVPVAEGESPRLTVDVMTPHFSAYYQGKRTDPLEVEDPTPIPFLVSIGGAYDITLTARTPAGVGLLDLAMALCLAALDELGVGGKTGKGYGYFAEG